MSLPLGAIGDLVMIRSLALSANPSEKTLAQIADVAKKCLEFHEPEFSSRFFARASHYLDGVRDTDGEHV